MKKKEEINSDNIQPTLLGDQITFSERIKYMMLEVAGNVAFFMRFIREVFTPPFEIQETINQSYEISFKSLIPVSITAFIMGLVLVLQSRPSLVEFGAGSYLPAMASASIIREIGPMITALVCAGNIGSSISAELGSMKVTEQIDSMEVSGINPFKYLVVTRILACTFMLPVLVVLADVVALVGAYLGTNIKGESSLLLFFNQVIEKLTFHDVIPALIKTVLFGFTIGLISCYKGFHSEKGTQGVGRSTNSAVVTSLILVIVIDMIVVQIANTMNFL